MDIAPNFPLMSEHDAYCSPTRIVIFLRHPPIVIDEALL